MAMLMFTQQQMLEHENNVARAERARLAAYLREKAEAHPTWMVHDLLKDLAVAVENNDIT
jgi:hypothetical protein